MTTEIKGTTPFTYAKDYIIDELTNYAGNKVKEYNDIVGYLTEQMLANNSIIFNTKESREYIIEWADEVVSLKKDLALSEDTMESPEMYMALAVARAIEIIMARLESQVSELLAESGYELTEGIIDYISTKTKNMGLNNMFLA